ncbi:aminotransferase class V-fold PLP-dependent enzyme [Bacteroidota bacterium]
MVLLKSKISQIRQDFPILNQQINGNPLIYLDNAATTQKPQQVIDAIVNFYTTQNANVHRGNYFLSQLATEKYENVRENVKAFINARSSNEIIFTRGTTESINLVSQILGHEKIRPGDEILITAMEHHSNIVPWQMLCEEKEAILKVVPINSKGELILDNIPELINEKTKIFAFTHVSNALGTINPVKELVELARSKNVITVVDGAQGACHLKVDVQEMDCDFYAFSGHKIYGPTGIGVLYGKEELLRQLPPYQGGGEMIHTVTFEKTTYNDLPYKFEAGTPNIADTIAFGTALDYMRDLGLENIAEYENQLLEYATQKLCAIEGLKIIGTAKHKTSVISFLIEGTHPGDLGVLLDKMGIAVRVGHHCAQPLMDGYDIPGTVRASFAFYNTFEEVDTLVKSLIRAVGMLR